jgi:hypothetical protein
MCLFFYIVLAEIERRKHMLRIQRRHIAVTRRGICFDHVDVPGGKNLIRRTLIK